MRQLILIRHAKAEAGANDRQRALTPRGLADAAAAGQALARAGVSLGVALVSPATRARQTWDRIQAGLAGQVPVVIEEDIYRNRVDLLFELVQRMPAELDSLALVGHNPAMAEFGYLLDDGAGDRAARSQLLAGYPTSAVASFGVAGEWDQLLAGSATLLRFEVGRG